MESLAKLFDTYSLRARVKPAAFIVLPIALSIITFYEPARSAGGALITFLTSFGVMSYTANQMSTRGNIAQKKLFNKWGGSPSTLLLRYRNDEIDVNTKLRYQKFLSKHISDYEVVTPEEEAAEPIITDCMLRPEPITHFGIIRSLISGLTDHSFRFKPIVLELFPK